MAARRRPTSSRPRPSPTSTPSPRSRPVVCSAQPTRGPAFLYAESDIAALIGAARSLAPSGGLRPHTYATLIGLLACTGLRITEALTLRADDVDLSAGVLTIRQTKFRKSRLVPLHASAVAPLRDYTADRDRRCDRKPDMTFFVSDTGHRLPYTTVRHAFHALLRQAMPGVVPVNRVRPHSTTFGRTGHSWGVTAVAGWRPFCILIPGRVSTTTSIPSPTSRTSSVACRPTPQENSTSTCRTSGSSRTPQHGVREPLESAPQDAKP